MYVYQIQLLIQTHYKDIILLIVNQMCKILQDAYMVIIIDMPEVKKYINNSFD